MYLRLCTRDPHQLFLRLESQVREFVIEMKVKLLKQLNSGYKSPPEAKSFIQLLLDEYEHLCVVSRKMGKILEKLVSILVGYFQENIFTQLGVNCEIQYCYMYFIVKVGSVLSLLENRASVQI